MSTRLEGSLSSSNTPAPSGTSNPFLQSTEKDTPKRRSVRISSSANSRERQALTSEVPDDVIEVSPPPQLASARNGPAKSVFERAYAERPYTPVPPKSNTKAPKPSTAAMLRVSQDIRQALDFVNSPEAQAILSQGQSAQANARNELSDRSSSGRADSSSRTPPSHTFFSEFGTRANTTEYSRVLPASPRVPPAQMPTTMLAHANSSEPEIPLHTSSAARLQHLIATGIAAAPPVRDLVAAPRSSDQIPHWTAMQHALLSKQHLSPEEQQLQLHLLRELQALHSEGQELNRRLQQAQMDRARDLIARRDATGTSASRPILISHSPHSDAAFTSRGPPATAPSASQGHHTSPATRQDPPPPAAAPSASQGHHTSSAARQDTIPPAMSHAAPPAAMAPRLQLPPKPALRVTWLGAAQDASRDKAKRLKTQFKEEQAAYSAAQRIAAEDAHDQALINAATSRMQQRRQLREQPQPIVRWRNPDFCVLER
jgi:hypothetical protein